MKKALFALVAAIVLGGAASAQYYSYGFINSGEKSYSIGIGSSIPLSPVMQDGEFTTVTSQTAHVPGLSAVLRAQREFAMDETFSWGYQYELNWIRYGADYTQTMGNATMTGAFDRWDLRFDIRLVLGFYITDELEIQLCIGGGDAFLNGIENRYTLTENGDTREEDDSNPVRFGGYYSANALLGVNYSLNDNIFAFVNLRGDVFSNNYFDIFGGGGNYSYRLVPMVGVGVKL